MTDAIRHLLRDIFNCDFAKSADAKKWRKVFFDKTLALHDLKKISDLVTTSTTPLGGKKIPASLLIKGNAHKSGAPLCILAQLHGNEPAGLAGILVAMALSEAGLLEHDVIAVIGNPLAARQYFEAWESDPKARQEKHDAYRCGLDENGKLLPDMNRIPADFGDHDPSNPHIKRAQELYTLGLNICGILDIHSARGDMVCITDHKHDRDLKHSSIRSLLTDLADAISGHASALTLKTIVSPLHNIQYQVGIEAGKHEAPDTPRIAAEYTLSLLYGLGMTKVEPLHGKKDDGMFENYAVKPRMTYGDLVNAGAVKSNDKIYMAMECHAPEKLPKQTSRVVVRKKDKSYAVQTVLEYIVSPGGTLTHAIYQYNEMEAVKKNQVVAVAIPSGMDLRVPRDFSGIFWSKSATLYDKDPAVGPWPVDAVKLASTKFCYPCDVSEIKLSF